MLHGLGGSARSAYVLGMMRRIAAAGHQGIAMQYRGIGEGAGRPRHLYHAGAWRDVAAVAARARERFPGRRLTAVGFSLGGCILINWLARAPSPEQPDRACTISTPFDLDASADAIGAGFARLYEIDLLRGLKALYARRFGGRAEAPVTVDALRRIRSLRAFDDAITAPLHGYPGAAAYYRDASPGRQLARIRRPTLLIQAMDDPFVPRHSLPNGATVSAHCHLELQPRGGHVGFVTGSPRRPQYWVEERFVSFLETPDEALAIPPEKPA